jgi:hypothetical protein
MLPNDVVRRRNRIQSGRINLSLHTYITYERKKIIRHKYRLKEKRAYRGLHHSIPTSEIKDELEKKATK